MTKTHFAGINTSQIADAAEGHAVLISFADIARRPGIWERELLPRLEQGVFRTPILDSGAFTVLSQGMTISIEDYVGFCVKYGHLFDQIVTLDDIGGDLATTWNNTQKMIEAGLDPIPVFHGREPFDVLRHYVQKFKRVGLGFFREPVKEGGRIAIAKDQGNGLNPDEWLEEALNICEEAGVDVHGFGMVRYAMKRGHTRMTTSDSTTWNAEYLALRAKKITGGDRLGDGDAALAIGHLDDGELMRLAMASYNGTGADEEIVALTADCAGQAKTVLQRFNSHQLWIQIDIFEGEAERMRATLQGTEGVLNAIA